MAVVEWEPVLVPYGMAARRVGGAMTPAEVAKAKPLGSTPTRSAAGILEGP